MDDIDPPEPTETGAPALEPWQEADSLAADAIAEIAGSFNEEESLEADSVESQEPATEPSEDAPPEGTEAAADAPEERGMARLVEREVEVRRQSEALEARVKAFEARESRLAELEEKAGSYQSDFHEHLRNSPTEALKAAGHDPDHVVRLYLAEKFAREGKPVPENLKVEIEKAQDRREREQLRQEVQQFKQQQAAQQFIAGIEAGARTYIEKGISKDAPTVAEVAAKQPERVYREIMNEIASHARTVGKEPNATVLSYEDASKRVEARWAEMRSLFGTPAPPTASTPGPKTLAPKVPTKGVPTTSKPLTPKKPASQDELEKLAIEEGIAEYKRAETAKKARV